MFKLYYWLALLSLLYCATGVQPKSKASIIVAGNFSIDGKIVNIAQYDVSSGRYNQQLVVLWWRYNVALTIVFFVLLLQLVDRT